jgi:nitrogen fixation NifU-like protein
LGEDKKMSLYNEKVMSHFRNPHNMGSIENPDGVGKVGNIICGDVMHLYIKVKERSDGEDVIEDIKQRYQPVVW